MKMAKNILALTVFAAALITGYLLLGIHPSKIDPQQGIKMKITSKAFEHNQSIPAKYTCEGDDISPPLTFSDIPQAAKSLALIVDDPDAPAGTANPGWVHWLVYNIGPETSGINENDLPPGALQGQNDWGRNDWGGPCPPSGTHRYFFRLYALDQALELEAGLTKTALLSAIKPHIIAETELIGLYTKRS